MEASQGALIERAEGDDFVVLLDHKEVFGVVEALFKDVVPGRRVE